MIRKYTKEFLIVVSFFIMLISFFVFPLQKKEITLEEVKLNDKVDSSMFAIMIGDLEGNYTESEENILPQKEDGYIFNPNKSICVNSDGEDLGEVLSYRNNMIKLKVREASYCHLYFDVISESDFCIDRGITNLKDCLLVMEDYSYDTEEAIEYIESKGSATTNAIAPTITYTYQSNNQKNDEGVVSFSSNIAIGTSFTINSTTGLFSLKNANVVTMSDSYVSSEDVNYYTCGSLTKSGCITLYKINAYTMEVGTTSTTYKITDADVYTYKTLDSFDSEVGLYKTTDADGDTYFYRGAVKNNYVSFGGYIWRIVRINGNGTVRMIYSGTSTSDTGSSTSIGISDYNSKSFDPTYVGYMYSDDDMIYRENTTLTTYTNVRSSYKYYYGKSFTKNETDRTFQLSQTEGDTINGTWSESYQEALNDGYVYTCFSTSKKSACDRIFKLNSYVSESSAEVYYITYNSLDYSSTLNNTANSTIKDKIDTWYETNIIGKIDSKGIEITNYIDTNAEFCNDRSIYSGSGYLTVPLTRYGSVDRVSGQTAPSLSCDQASDKFSVANGSLKYPVALLTIDEVLLAGGKAGSVNNQYYLYTGQTYWTMTPYAFLSTSAHAYVYCVGDVGQVSHGNYVAADNGVRPVINLSSEVMISQGIGTKDNPYILTLPNS